MIVYSHKTLTLPSQNVKVNKIAKAWIEETISLMQKGIEDTRFVLKMGYKIDDEGIWFEYPEYGKWIDSGRRAGKRPPISALLGWMKYHDIPEKAAFPIAKKIGKEGIKPRPFLHIFDDRINILVDNISNELYEQIMDA